MHTAVAVSANGGREHVERVLEDFETAPIEPKLRAALGFLRKLTLTPEAMIKEDLAPLLAAGVSRDAIRDAIYVCYLFSVYTRLADTLGWEVPPDGAVEFSVRRLLRHGYRH